MTKHDEARRAGWVHHPQVAVAGPLDVSMQVPVPVTAGGPPLILHLVFTDDGLYVPAVSRQPPGAGPFPTVIAIHGGSGGLGIPYLSITSPTRAGCSMRCSRVVSPSCSPKGAARSRTRMTVRQRVSTPAACSTTTT